MGHFIAIKQGAKYGERLNTLCTIIYQKDYPKKRVPVPWSAQGSQVI